MLRLVEWTAKLSFTQPCDSRPNRISALFEFYHYQLGGNKLIQTQWRIQGRGGQGSPRHPPYFSSRRKEKSFGDPRSPSLISSFWREPITINSVFATVRLSLLAFSQQLVSCSRSAREVYERKPVQDRDTTKPGTLTFRLLLQCLARRPICTPTVFLLKLNN